MTVRKIIGDLLRSRFTYAVETSLARTHHGDLERFRTIAPQFQQVYARFAQNDCSPYILDTWQGFNDQFAQMCKPSLPEDFLHHPVVLDTLTANPVKPTWKPFLADLLGLLGEPTATRLLEETVIGNPRICDRPHLTSPGRIMHAWMLASYFDYLRSRGQDGAKLNTVVEFGGGYGGLAHVWSRFSERRPTYIIFDTPIMCALQWQYLTALNGEDKVVPIFEAGQPIVPGSINLLPVSMMTRGDIRGDVFVSTWALSESNGVAQQAVSDANWFGAPHLLLAFQRSTEAFPYAEKLRSIVAERNGLVREMPHSFVNNFTAFV